VIITKKIKIQTEEKLAIINLKQSMFNEEERTKSTSE